MPNEVKIIIKADVQTKAGFDKADKEATLAGDKAGNSYLTAFGKRMATLATALTGQVQQTGTRIGQDMGGKVGEQVEQKLTESVRKSRKRAKPEAEQAGKGIGQDIGDALTEPIAKKVTGALYVSRSRSQGAARETGDAIGTDIGDALTEPIARKVTGALYVSRSRSRGAARETGDAIGTEIGDRAGARISERINSSIRKKFRGGSADVDVDTHKGTSAGGLAEDAAKEGIESGRSFGQSFLSGVSGFLNSSVIGQTFTAIGLTIAAVLAAAIASSLAAAIVAGVLGALGGGVLMAGIMGALQDPIFRGNDPKHPFKTGAIADLKKQFSGLLAEFGKPFRAPVADFLEKLLHFVESLTPKMRQLADSMAPVLGELGTGLISLLQNAMPGILEAVEASKPLLETLAKHMPEIGNSISKFFKIIAGQGDDANLFFSDLLHLIEVLIPIIGGLIAVLASAYDKVHSFGKAAIRAFGTAKRAVTDFATEAGEKLLEFASWVIDHVFAPLLIGASEAFGWIPGIGPKLKRAESAFNAFRKKVNDELARVHDKTVTIKIRQVFTQVGEAVVNAAGLIRERMATGGIKGAATGAVSGGWTWVGERGPELAKLPPGTSVRTAGDSARMAGGGGGEFVFKFESSGNAVLDELFRWFLERTRTVVRTQHGGNVQAAIGRA